MNKIEVMDNSGNILSCEVIKIIENKELNRRYVVYKDNNDILVSRLIGEDNNYQIIPVEDDEWDYIEKNLE
jgi:uncharacterized protein YrzB (UPF0473 family)